MTIISFYKIDEIDKEGLVTLGNCFSRTYVTFLKMTENKRSKIYNNHLLEMIDEELLIFPRTLSLITSLQKT